MDSVWTISAQLPGFEPLRGDIKTDVLIIGGSHRSGKRDEVFHTERPISKAYKVLDNDLARDNVENDMPEADLRDI